MAFKQTFPPMIQQLVILNYNPEAIAEEEHCSTHDTIQKYPYGFIEVRHRYFINNEDATTVLIRRDPLSMDQLIQVGLVNQIEDLTEAIKLETVS